MTRILPAGPDAVLVELESRDAVDRAYAALRAQPIEGVVDIVPAARTILIAGPSARAAADNLVSHEWPALVPGTAAVVEIPVTYDGPDLVAAAAYTGLSHDEIVRLHAGATYRVAFCGFAPGFAYLTGLPEALHLPRHASPRTSIPAGAVAIAGEFAGIYPRASPAGWQWIGRTDLDLWDAGRDPPALLVPGTQVRFVVVQSP